MCSDIWSAKQIWWFCTVSVEQASEMETPLMKLPDGVVKHRKLSEEGHSMIKICLAQSERETGIQGSLERTQCIFNLDLFSEDCDSRSGL
jgi:hypothetical protein